MSFFLNKAFHCGVTTFAGCNMQGSSLIGESKEEFETIDIVNFKLTDFHICQCKRLSIQVTDISDCVFKLVVILTTSQKLALELKDWMRILFSNRRENEQCMGTVPGS